MTGFCRSYSSVGVEAVTSHLPCRAWAQQKVKFDGVVKISLYIVVVLCMALAYLPSHHE